MLKRFIATLLFAIGMTVSGCVSKTTAARPPSAYPPVKPPTPAYNFPPAGPPFRKSPRTNLSDSEVYAMIAHQQFFDAQRNRSQPGFRNEFKMQRNYQTVFDGASGLVWQRAGSPYYIDFHGAQTYIDSLNRVRYSGFSDWRLPTLEEAMTLLEPDKKNGDLHIDLTFAKKQTWIWSADRASKYRAWLVNFSAGYAYSDQIKYGGAYVRAVR